MKVLLITGRLAEPLVRRAIKTAPSSLTCKVLVLPTAVAAFLHPKFVTRHLKKIESTDEYDIILLPGMIAGDTTLVRNEIGIPTFKGPRHAIDLPLVWHLLEQADTFLSTTHPADQVLAEQRTKKAIQELENAEKQSNQKPPPPGTIQIGKGKRSLIAGPAFPMRIIAEITDVPMRTKEELVELAQYFFNSGASIIDVGMMAETPNSEIAREAVKTILDAVPIPVSIDSVEADEIIAGVEAGAALVLSLDKDNMDQIPKHLRQQAVYTIIPGAQARHYYPKEEAARVQLLEANLTKANELGYKMVVADLLFDSLIIPGLTPALSAYASFRNRNPSIHRLMGIGNVTELLDADSPGANAVLAGLASELGITFLLTTEVSVKTRGSVQELHRASQMMFLAQQRQTPPKDLGIDLLMLKSKTFPEESYSLLAPPDQPLHEIQEPAVTHKLDPQGHLTFYVDRKHNRLIAHHYTTTHTTTPNLILTAPTAHQLITAILAHNLISRLDHATYIGRELAKAEIALTTGRPYLQEAPLFPHLTPKP